MAGSSAVAVTIYMLILHSPGGQEITVNAKRIASLRQALDHEHTKKVKCVLNLTDGKFIAVVEPCAEIRRKLDLLSQNPPEQ